MRKYWSLKTIVVIWSVVALLTLAFALAGWAGLGTPLAGPVFAGIAVAALAAYSLVTRGTDGWGWIPFGLALGLLWQLIRLLLILLRALTRDEGSRWSRWG